MEILIIITLVACVVSVIISVITLLTQKRLAENIGVNKITDEQTAKQLEMLSEPCDKSRKHAYRHAKAELRRNSKAAVTV